MATAYEFLGRLLGEGPEIVEEKGELVFVEAVPFFEILSTFERQAAGWHSFIPFGEENNDKSVNSQ